MTVTLPEGAQALIPKPEKTPAAIRAAVARLNPAVLSDFESDWVHTMEQARSEYSTLPVAHFTEHWWTWAAVERWPELAGRLRECQRIVASSESRAERRAAAAEVGAILKTATEAE